MANIGYIQVVRHCNHFCGFCSNPTSAYVHTQESLRALVDDLADGLACAPAVDPGSPPTSPLTARSEAPQDALLRNL